VFLFYAIVLGLTTLPRRFTAVHNGPPLRFLFKTSRQLLRYMSLSWHLGDVGVLTNVRHERPLLGSRGF